MQNLKRALSLLLVVAMVASFMVCASAKTAEQLTDLSESKYQPEVRVLNALDIVEGYEDGTYKPAKTVSRAELALILARVRVGGDKEMIRTYNYGHMTYTDILANGYEWAASGIQYCTDNGMVVGNGNGQYRPGDTVTIVEALKMLLTALGYDAEKEGLQNVGAAWKANTLSLAKEAGLMNRVYGDTNKACTRDDIALLIYNFLMSKVVKGYFENDVANVDTILYDGGTALEVYFGKQVVYGAIVANEAADLDVYARAMNERVIDENNRLDAGVTQLFLYDNDEGVTLADLVNGKVKTQINRYGDKVVDDYFMYVKGLTTGLNEIGDSVFVITDLEPTKGNYYAAGGVCFATGNNEVGIKQWKNDELKGLTNSDTLYFLDYDFYLNNKGVNAKPSVAKGDYLKTVDFDGDDKLDLVLVENWNMTELYGVNKYGVLSNSTTGLNIYKGGKNHNLADDSVESGVANWHEADGMYYFVEAEMIKDTTLADDRGAVNYKNQTVTLANGETYSESGIDVELPFKKDEGYWTDLMDCADIPDDGSYNWYLDCGGYIRAYKDVAAAGNNNPIYLLTDASNEFVGRNGFAQTVNAVRQDTVINTYDVSNAGKTGLINQNTEKDWGLLIPALGDNVTNLAKTGVSEDGKSADLAKAETIVELNMKYSNWRYGTTDAMGQLGKYNMDNLVHDYNVLTTTNTDYYYVVLAKDRSGNTYVKSVEYYAGYLEMPAYDFNAAENVYALTKTDRDADGKEYYTANTIVIETFDLKTTTSAPYFAYYHVSSDKDGKAGLYDVVTPAGQLDTVWIENSAHQPGFYSRNDNTEKATMITENWRDYGLMAGTVMVSKAANDYYLIDSQAGAQIKITTDVPVYHVTMAGGKHDIDAQWNVDVCEHGMSQGDKIIYGWNGRNATYVLIVNAAYEWPYTEKWTNHDMEESDWSDAANVLWAAIAANKPLVEVDVYGEFAAAIKAHAVDPTAANYNAMIDAFLNAWNKAAEGKKVTSVDDNYMTVYETLCANTKAADPEADVTKLWANAEANPFIAKVAELEAAWDAACVEKEINVDVFVAGDVNGKFAAMSADELKAMEICYNDTYETLKTLVRFFDMNSGLVKAADNLTAAVAKYNALSEAGQELADAKAAVKEAKDAFDAQAKAVEAVTIEYTYTCNAYTAATAIIA